MLMKQINTTFWHASKKLLKYLKIISVTLQRPQSCKYEDLETIDSKKILHPARVDKGKDITNFQIY
jgi:hypothetical protein